MNSQKISRDVLSIYFDEWTVNEWIEQHLLPLQETVSALNKRAMMLTRDLIQDNLQLYPKELSRFHNT